MEEIFNIHNIEQGRGFFLMLLVIPLLAALTSITIKGNVIRFIANLSLSAILLCTCLTMLFRAGFYVGQRYNIFNFLPGIGFEFFIDQFGLSFATMIAFLWMAATIYSYYYVEENNIKNPEQFDSLFGLCIFSAIGVALSKNLLTTFIFYEFLTLVSYPLVAYLQNKESRAAANKYLYYLLICSVLFLLAIIIVYGISGSVAFEQGGIIDSMTNEQVVLLLMVLFVFGAAKAAIVPLHGWLVSAMVAPVPVSALLHAVAVVKVGVFVIIRAVNNIIGLDVLSSLSEAGNHINYITYLLAFSALYASFKAVAQVKIKKLLAYSTIANLSIITMLALTFSPAGIIAAVFLLISHAFAKITLFFLAGIFITNYGKEYINDMRGLIYKSPYTAIIFCVSLVAVIGVPPSGMFMAKFLNTAASNGFIDWVPLITVSMTSVISAFYYSKIIVLIFSGKGEFTFRKYEPALPLIAPLLCLVVTGMLFAFSSGFVKFLLSTYL